MEKLRKILKTLVVILFATSIILILLGLISLLLLGGAHIIGAIWGIIQALIIIPLCFWINKRVLQHENN